MHARSGGDAMTVSHPTGLTDTPAGLGVTAGTGRTGLGAAALLAGLIGVSGVAWAGLMRQARVTGALIEAAAMAAGASDGTLPEGAEFAWQAVPPSGDGVYLPDGRGPLADVPDAVVLSMLGDSTAVGYGCTTADEVPGVVLARGVAAALDRPARLITRGVVGSGAADLARQITAALPDRPDVVVIVVGANDVRDRIPPHRSAQRLGQAVAAVHAQGVPVVVGTCPDLGVITPIPQPLRAVVKSWSRTLASLQERAVRSAGGVPVAIGRLVSPDFYGRPDLFYADGFHPSGPGYARAVAALLPEVLAALR
jgi:lysophospholipase L1-like esterase